MNATDPLLQDLLARRAESVHVSVTDLAERAIARDRSNRHREVATVAAVGALALAVAVPLAGNVLGSVRAAQVPATPGPTMPVSSAPPTPSPTSPTASRASRPTSRPTTPVSIPTITATGGPAPVTLTPATGPVTGTTDVSYVIDGTFHVGSQAVPLPKALSKPARIARLADGGVLVQGPKGLVVLDRTGAQIGEVPGGDDFAVSEDLTHFVVSGQSGDLTYHDARGRQLNRLDLSTCGCRAKGAISGGYTAVGLVGTTAYASRGYLDSSVAWDVRSQAATRLKGHLSLVSEAGGTGLVTYPDTTPGDKDYACSELRDLQTRATRWRLCGPVLFLSFSPDGSYLIGTGSLDSLPDSMLTKDRSLLYGSVVVWRTSDATLVAETQAPQSRPWSLAARMSAQGGDVTVQVDSGSGDRNLQRCSLDGSCEVVAPAKPLWQADIPDGNDPYILSLN